MRRIIPDAHKELGAPGATSDGTIVRATARGCERAALAERTDGGCLPDRRTNGGSDISGRFSPVSRQSDVEPPDRRQPSRGEQEIRRSRHKFQFFGKVKSLDRGTRPRSKDPFASHFKVP
jgi:hypothetical protein